MAARKVGLIGLGLLGSAISERLLGAGYPVHGFDIEPSRRSRLGELGGIPEDSPAAVALSCRWIVLSLPDSKVVETTLRQVSPHLKPTSTIMDTTTGAPEDGVAFAAALDHSGHRYLDTTVGGSSAQVRRREAIVIAGGDERALRDCRPILGSFGRKIYHAGPSGSGARMKLVVNLVLGLNRAALAEGLAFAEGLGLPPSLALEVLMEGPAGSKAMERKGPKMLADDFEPEARLSQHLKDVRLMLESARRCGVRLPLSRRHAKLLESAERLGYGDADNSAVIKAFD